MRPVSSYQITSTQGDELVIVSTVVVEAAVIMEKIKPTQHDSRIKNEFADLKNLIFKRRERVNGFSLLPFRSILRHVL